MSSSRYYRRELCVHEEFAVYTVHSQKKSAAAQLRLPGGNNLLGCCTFLLFCLARLLLARVLEPLPAVTGVEGRGFLPGHVATFSQRRAEHVDVRPFALVPRAKFSSQFSSRCRSH